MKMLYIKVYTLIYSSVIHSLKVCLFYLLLLLLPLSLLRSRLRFWWRLWWELFSSLKLVWDSRDSTEVQRPSSGSLLDPTIIMGKANQHQFLLNTVYYEWSHIMSDRCGQKCVDTWPLGSSPNCCHTSGRRQLGRIFWFKILFDIMELPKTS